MQRMKFIHDVNIRVTDKANAIFHAGQEVEAVLSFVSHDSPMYLVRVAICYGYVSVPATSLVPVSEPNPISKVQEL